MTSAPTPAQVDQLAKEHLALKEKWLDAKLHASKLQELLEINQELLRKEVTEHGSAHAEKSKLLHGIGYEIMASYGVTTSTDAAAVERFREALVEAKQTRLLKKVFQQTIRWTLEPMAAVVIKGEKLSKSLLALYSQCEVVKAKTPTLTVREKSA